MTDSDIKQRRLAFALMLLAVVPLALGSWRLYVWRWGQPGDFIRYDPPRIANWERLSEEYRVMADTVRRNNPQSDADNEKASRYLELAQLLVQDHESRLSQARRRELWFGLFGLAGAFVVFNAGYWRRDKLATVG
jgi:hypothetical protein